ncbi:MAG: hypothetical protein L3J47_10095 [Sulfurovum sp.]|nr:hypothetical protein [Sulfurovum sp.]
MDIVSPISEKKLDKLAKHLSKEFGISKDEAFGIICDEWDLVETLFAMHQKPKDVKKEMVTLINDIYRIA